MEKIDIPKSPYLPEVTIQHFEMYLKKIARVIIHALQQYLILSVIIYINIICNNLHHPYYFSNNLFTFYLFFQRYRKHSRMNLNANKPTTPNELLQNFPNLKKVKSLGKIL